MAVNSESESEVIAPLAAIHQGIIGMVQILEKRVLTEEELKALMLAANCMELVRSMSKDQQRVGEIARKYLRMRGVTSDGG